MHFWYFCITGSMKSPETLYAKSMAPTDDSISFLLIGSCVGPSKRLQNFLNHAVSCRNFKVTSPSAFFFARFLAYQASCRGKSRVFGIAKLYFIWCIQDVKPHISVTLKSVLIFSVRLRLRNAPQSLLYSVSFLDAFITSTVVGISLIDTGNHLMLFCLSHFCVS